MHVSVYTVPSFIAGALIGVPLSILGKTCDKLVLPLPRFFWRRILAPPAAFALRPIHYVVLKASGCIPMVAHVCASAVHIVERTCAQTVGMPFWCTRTLLSECAADYLTVEWASVGRLKRKEPVEVLLISDLNRCVCVCACVCTCVCVYVWRLKRKDPVEVLLISDLNRCVCACVCTCVCVYVWRLK